MNPLIKIILICLFASFISGCGLSKEEISETVQSSMQNTFDTDPEFKKWNMEVLNVQVFKQGDNNYKGLANIAFDGTSHDVVLQIAVDGENVMWEAPAGSFLFVAQKELRDIFSQ